MKKITRHLLVGCGTLCVALGIVGMFLPVFPTTPFLLLAAVCYARSSERCYHWLISNRWFGAYIRNYREGRGMALKQKVLTLSLLWLMIGYATWFVVSKLWLKLVLLAISLTVTVHLLKIRTFRNQKPRLARLEEGPSSEKVVRCDS